MSPAGRLARWVIVAILALAVGFAVWWLTRTEPAPPLSVVQGGGHGRLAR